MLVKIISLLAAATAVTAQSSTIGPAPAVTNNPAGAYYVGTLPEKAGSNLRGSISAVSVADGQGVRFSVAFSGLPTENGPFMYHIHEKPVPSDGNCTGTGAHLDPYKRGEAPICDAKKPETCQVGDLSGKYGNITAQSFSQEYVDLYATTVKGNLGYFGGRSFVVHLSNKTRIGCANFTEISAGIVLSSSVAASASSVSVSSSSLPKPSETSHYNTSATLSSSATSTGSPIPPTSASASTTAPAQFTNAAAKVVGGAAALVAAAAALVL